MSPVTTSPSDATSNLLQLHHNFRWIISNNKTEPVAGFLQRYLRRRLIAAGAGRCAEAGQSAGLSRPATGDDDDHDHDDDAMNRVVDWLPRAWQEVNRFLESRRPSTDVTIGIAV